MEDECLERFDIVQSENDDRLYRGLKLINGMKVILISDPTTEKAAAALDICVGSTSDPNNMPGLARLYQYLVYLKKGNKQKSFKTYVEKNNGKVNAITQFSFATYYFDINPSEFKHAFNHFVNFFNAPPILFKNIVKELSNIVDELERSYKSNQSDEMKTVEFFNWIRHHHEIHEKTDELLIETTKTVDGNEILKLLNIFYWQYFIANNMTLCILGKENLNALENLVVNRFSSLKKGKFNNIPCGLIPPCPSSVYKIHYVPHEDYNKLHVIFDLNAKEYTYYYFCTPDRFLSYLFEYHGRGSLSWALKTRGWCSCIQAGMLRETRQTFIVTFDLTEKGLDHFDDIMKLFFQYVNMLKENNGLRRIYNEYKEIQELKFRFKKNESGLEYVKCIARSMNDWPLSFALRGKNVPFRWERDYVQKVIEGFLSPLSMSVYVASKKYETITDKTASCYNYKYKIERISVTTSSAWTKIHHQTEFDFPACNEFIPTSTNVKPRVENKLEKSPTVLKRTDLFTLWYKEDDVFNEPRASMMFHFNSGRVNFEDIYMHFTRIFIQLLNNSLSEYVYPASLVNLHWKIDYCSRGIQLKISGFDSKQHVLLEKIIDRMVNFKINLQDFIFEKQKHVELCKKTLKKVEENYTSCQQARYYISILITDSFCSVEETLKQYDDITFEKMRKFPWEFFRMINVVGLIHGNINPKEALDITRMIENKLPRTTPWTSTLIRSPTLQPDHHYIFIKENNFSKNSCTLIYYEIPRSTKWEIVLEFIRNVFYERCVTQLIKTEKLGNEACFDVSRLNRSLGLIICVQGKGSYENGIHIMYSHKNVEEKIDKFLFSIMDYVSNMPEEEFEKLKTSYIETCQAKKPKTLNDLSEVFWNEIFYYGQKNFQPTDVKIEELRKITSTDLFMFLKEIMDVITPKLSIHVSSTKGTCIMNETISSARKHLKKYNNVKEFKKDLYLGIQTPF